MADRTDYDDIAIAFTPRTRLSTDASGAGRFEIVFSFPGTYNANAQLFLQFPEGVTVDSDSSPKLSSKDSAGVSPLSTFSGHPANNPQSYTSRWLDQASSDPVILVSGKLSNAQQNQFKVAVSVLVKMTNGAANKRIKAWILDDQNRSFDSSKTKCAELPVENGAPAAKLKIASVTKLTPGYQGADVWWVKGTGGTKLTVEAAADLSDNVFLHWQDADMHWHALSKKGSIDVAHNKRVTFDLEGDSDLESLIGNSAELSLKIGLKSDTTTASAPDSPIELKIQREAERWGLGAASATFDAHGKLALVVVERVPATSSGIERTEYSTDDGVTWGAFTPSNAFDAKKNFLKGIQVRAKSHLEQDSTVIDALIDAQDIYTAEWPTYNGAAVGSKLSFNVSVQALHNLILPIEHATVTLPDGMTASHKRTFDFNLAELQTAPFSHTENVVVDGPAGDAIHNAILRLTSTHFQAAVDIPDTGNKGNFKPGTAADQLGITFHDQHPLTNSAMPFVDVTLSPTPGKKTVHIQYKDGAQWKDIPAENVQANKDGTFRVSLPKELIKNDHIPNLKLRATTAAVPKGDNDYGHETTPVDVTIKDDKPTIKSVVIVKDEQGKLVARVNVLSDANNPAVNAHIHKEGDAAASNPGDWKPHTLQPGTGDDHTIDIPIEGNDLRQITVEVVNKAGVISDATAARIENYIEVFDVQFKLDGISMVLNAASNVKAGDHTLEVIVTPKYHLSSYHLDGFLGIKGQYDANLHKKSAPVATGSSEFNQYALGEWDGHQHFHLLTVKELSSSAGALQPYTLTFHLAFAPGQSDRKFEVRVSDSNAPVDTDSSKSNEGVYTATFNMVH